MSARRPVAWALLAGMVAFAAAASCFVSRKSSDYACSTDDDCETGRACDRGYCVAASVLIDAAPCPAVCNGGCNQSLRTCMVECDESGECDNVTCPSGYSCIINCRVDNACDNVTCNPGTSCTVNCMATNACEDILCSVGVPCSVTCGATGSCGAIDCDAACQCDVTCATGNCGTMSCPTRGSSSCSKGGVVGAECDSSFSPSCATCP